MISHGMIIFIAFVSVVVTFLVMTIMGLLTTLRKLELKVVNARSQNLEHVASDPNRLHTVPEHMTLWVGGPGIPGDWDHGEVLTRCGIFVQPHVPLRAADWAWSGNPDCPPGQSSNGVTDQQHYWIRRAMDVVAYTPKKDVPSFKRTPASFENMRSSQDIPISLN